MNIIHPYHKESNDRILIINDIHIPYQSIEGVELLFKFIPLYQPTRVIINGDLLDEYPVSKFLKHPHYGYTLSEEIEKAKIFLQRLRVCVGGIPIDFICGNHDFRLQQFLLRQAPELLDMVSIAIPNLLDLHSLKINWYPAKEFASSFVDNWLTITCGEVDNKIHIGHFNKINQGAGMTVRQLMMKREGSFIQGHIHRAALIWRRTIDNKMHFGLENPCLYDAKYATYVGDQDWALGFSTLTHGVPELILIQDNKIVYGGQKVSL